MTARGPAAVSTTRSNWAEDTAKLGAPAVATVTVAPTDAAATAVGARASPTASPAAPPFSLLP